MRVFRAYYQLSPNVDIKNELKQTAINITCYDKDGNAIKDPEIDNPGCGSGSGGSGSSCGGGTSGGSSDEHD